MNNHRSAAQESRGLMSAQFPIMMTFLGLSGPDASGHGLVNMISERRRVFQKVSNGLILAN
jgi:hypothetical protein